MVDNLNSLIVKGSEVFLMEYELEFKLSIEALLNAYSDVFTKAALSHYWNKPTSIMALCLWNEKASPNPTQAH